jgi:hypothetical protein
MRAQTIGPQGAVQFMTLMDRKDDRPEIVVSLIGESASSATLILPISIFTRFLEGCERGRTAKLPNCHNVI